MNSAPRRSSFEPRGDEAALIRAAQGGDEAAFAELVGRYQRAIYRIAHGLTRNSADADDLAQETFVRAYRALGRVRPEEPLYPWLARIVVNLTYSLFRHRRRRPETPIEPLVEAGRQWAAEDDPARDVAESEGREQLQASFAELSHEHQAVLVLRVVDGLSYDEIARSLGVPVGTVMSSLSRARAELKTRLRARTGESP